jgi:exopolyphosphatase / guanosine-5'-triphosphate,3'-diphosphate pyrophosphatase
MNVAAIDIGTNSVRLLITDAAGNELARLMQVTRLGQSVDVTGELHPDAIARTNAVLRTYREEITKHAVARLRATATSAARDARNSAAFFDEAEQILGQRPELLPGEEEAALSFQGATSSLTSKFPGPYLVIDIGGGSTEFVLGERAPEQLISTNMGCVRMAERHLKSDPHTEAEIEACFADIRGILQTVKQTIDVGRARTVVGLAGTITSIAYLHLGLTAYDPARSNHTTLSRDAVEQVFTQLLAGDVAKRRTLLLEPKRAEVILGGAAVLLTLMRELDIRQLVVSEADILDGLAASLR